MPSTPEPPRPTGSDRREAATGRSGSDAGVGRALETNLAQTAVEVVIPDEHLVLLDISSPWFGVHRATEELLREVHHHYASWPQTLTDVHRRATSDFHHYNRHARGPEALSVYCDIYARIVEQAADPAVRADAVRLWLNYLGILVTRSGTRLEANLGVVGAALSRMRALIEPAPGLAAEASSRLRRLAQDLAACPSPAAGPVLDDALELLATALGHVYRAWGSREDPLTWYREIAGEDAGDLPPEALQRISHARLRRHLDELATLTGADGGLRACVRQLLVLPDDREIVNAYLDAAQSVAADSPTPSGLLARVHWVLHLLEQDGLASVHEAALREVNSLCSRLIGAGERPAELVHEVFALLRRARFPRTRAVHELVGSIGSLAVASGDPGLVEALVEEMLGFDFDYPDFSGFTSEWGVEVSPAHLRGIRMYLRMIEADPLLASPLIAALVVHLRLGGVLILDTDLFQRDISSLLGREVAPVYLLVTQLLRLFPVYFNEIGAEGELRRTSTRLDEIEERRDPLCHFLRKQSHVDCNPLLASFADEIFRFWATGDPGPLARYVPETVMGDLLVADGAGARGPAEIAARLAEREGGVERVLALEPEAVDARLAELPGSDAIGREKVSLLFHVRGEIRRKYALGHADVIPRLQRFGRIDTHRVTALAAALERGDPEEALDALLSVLEGLQGIILSPGPVEAFEDIYHKRHIAAGIPSMYGSYREDRFEAAGLTFRLESLAGALMERVMADDGLGGELTRDRMRAVARWLHLLHRAVRIGGYRAQGLAHCLSLLDQAVETDGVTVEQYMNIFQLTSRSVETLVRARILDAYEEPARRIVGRMIERGVLAPPPDDGEWAALKISETFMRDLIAESPGLEQLDALVGRVLAALTERRDPRSQSSTRPAPLDLDASVVAFGAGEDPRAGIMTLGNKGFMLSRLVHLGFRVPSGFILTTELVRHPDGLAHPSDVPPRVVAAHRRAGRAPGARDRTAGWATPRTRCCCRFAEGRP